MYLTAGREGMTGMKADVRTEGAAIVAMTVVVMAVAEETIAEDN
jgi:hypothetical protein